MEKLILFTLLFTSVAAQQCNITGICINSEIIEVLNDVVDYDECLQECKQISDCQWFSYYPNGLLCEIFKNCVEIDPEICQTCVTSEKTCGDNHALTKVLLISGYPYAKSQNTELVDLTTGHSCQQNLPLFPYEMGKGFGGLCSENMVLVCGGAFGTAFQDCYFWDLTTNLGFQKTNRPLVEPRYGGAGVVTTNGLWITGGRNAKNEFLDSSEMVTLDQIEIGPKLPFPMAFHCMAKINE